MASSTVSSETGSFTTSSRSAAQSTVDVDPDRRSDAYDKDDKAIVYLGHEAGPTDRRSIIDIVNRYQKAAAAGDGATACSLIYSPIAESVVEDYGRSPAGPPALRGKTCAVVMSKLFKQQHQQLTGYLAMLHITKVRIDGNQGLALLGLKTGAEPYMTVRHEHGVWKVGSLLDPVMQ
jgi:hypothetical protein